MHRTHQRKRAIRRRVLLSAVACVFTLCAAEGAIRLFALDTSAQPVSRPHPLWHHWNVPDTAYPFCLPKEGIHQVIRFNSAGQRDSRNHARNRSANTLRIAVLGDSFVQGMHVDELDTVTRRLEVHLGGSSRVEVLNFGCSGFCTLLEEVLLREEVLDYDPQLVICFHHATDLTEDWLTTRKARYDDQGKFIVPGGPHPGLALRQAMHQVKLYQLAQRALATPRSPVPESGGSLKHDVKAIIHEPYSPDDEEAWHVSLASLERMAGLCRARKVGFLVVVIPLDEQVEFQNRTQSSLAEPGRRLENIAYQRRLCSFCASTDIPCLDLLPGFREENPTGAARLFLPRDRHWTEAGHDLAAQLVAAKITALLVPPAHKP